MTRELEDDIRKEGGEGRREGKKEDDYVSSSVSAIPPQLLVVNSKRLRGEAVQ